MKTFTCKMMLLVLVGLMAWMNGNAKTVINGGNVSGKWTKAESPYQVNGNITVAQGTVLEIEPGVTVAFGNGCGLTINGQLLAEGTSDDNIVFIPQVVGNYWQGLTFSAPKMPYNLNQCGCLGYAAGVNYNWEANYDDSNFDANPQFVNYALQNYRLKATSPCINAGIEDVTGLGLPNADIDGNIRIYGGRIDIGAYEYGAPTGIEQVTVQNQLMIYPNPSRDGIFQLATDNNEINWVVYDMKGKQISQGNAPLVDLSSCQKGIYVIKVQTGKDIVTGKLVKL